MVFADLGSFQLQRYTWDIIDSNSYFIKEEANGLLIDAVDSIELYKALDDIDNLVIILTHSHFDHICGLNQIRQMIPNTIVYATSLCSENIGNKYRNMSSSANAFLAFYQQKNNMGTAENFEVNLIPPITCLPANELFDEEMCFRWGDHSVRLVQCYGHTGDSLVAIFDAKYLFSGDTILKIPTVTRFPGGNTAKFWVIDVPILIELAKQIEIVFPGHGEPGSLSDMIALNQRSERFNNHHA